MAWRRLSTILNNSRSYSTVTNRGNLFSRISPIGDPSVSVIPIIETWLHQGNPLNAQHLNFIIKTLRTRRRFIQALQVSEWMINERVYTFTPRDYAVQLDLISRVRGVDSVEWYFLTLNDSYKTGQLYGALLNCYVREGLVDKSLSLLQKMKDMGFVYVLEYNNIMCLYTQTEQYEKVPCVLAQMKKSGVPPDAYSYRICMNSYGARSDIVSMEKMLKEVERESYMLYGGLGWSTYSMVANYYIKAGLKKKALICLQKCEDKADKRNALAYNHLISHYASLRNKKAMMRLWKLQKANCNKQLNREYITMLGSLVKLGDLDETEKLLEEWELSGNDYDFRVPNILLIGYSQKGLIEKAETMLRGMVEKGRTPIPNSWAIIAAGYVAKEKMQKAYRCMKEAVAVRAENIGWRPKANVVSSVLGWAANNRDIDEVEDFVNSLKTVISMNKDMYLSLLKMYVTYGKEIDEILESMNADKIRLDEEIRKVIISTKFETSHNHFYSILCT